MVSLVAMISSGKGTWGIVNSLMNNGKWDNVYLICNTFSYDNYNPPKSNCLKLRFDENDLEKSMKSLSKFFKDNIKDFEVALNLASGSGMEHMAVLSTILKAGLGVRFVYPEGNEVKEFELLEEDYSLVEVDEEI